MEKANKELKIFPEFFKAVIERKKTAELRKDDRNFKVGDIYTLREWNIDLNDYTGASVDIQITHILKDYIGLEEGYAMISFVLLDKVEDSEPYGISIDYEEEYHRCLGTIANIHNERVENQNAILAMSRIISEQDSKIKELQKRIEENYWEAHK